MSCQSNRYGTPPKSAYDRRMYEHYASQKYSTMQYPRSKFDIKLQQKWCPSCASVEQPTEKYTRSVSDMKLQQKWCPKCSPSTEQYAAALAHHDPDNIWSYTACGASRCGY